MKSTLTTKRRTARKVVPVLAITLLLATALSLTWLAVQPLPLHLIDQCDYQRNPKPTAPIIVVGVLASDTLVRKPVPMRSRPTYPLQLRRLSVRIENILKGGPLPESLTVYYFTFAGGFQGNRPLGFWEVGCRRILWLRWDAGVLRTVCDGYDNCTIGVYSGAHPNYRPDPKKPLDYALVDLLLTRGEGSVNGIGFATEAFREEPDNVSGLQEYAIEKLRYLALTEQDEIKSSACESLWIYTVDLVKPNIKRDAENAMHVANCRCNKKADGKCQ